MGEALERPEMPECRGEGEEVVYFSPTLCYNLKEHTQTTMTKQEELTLIAEAQSGSQKAQAAPLEKYDRLCHKLARKFAFTASAKSTLP